MVELFSACKVRSALCERSALVAGKILISKPVSTRKYVFETKYLTPNFHANVLISSHFAYPSKWRPKLWSGLSFLNQRSNFPSRAVSVCMKNIAEVKAYANGRNKSQRSCVLLGFFCQQCCVCLHGPKGLTGFKLYHVYARMLRVVGQQYCVRLHGP